MSDEKDAGFPVALEQSAAPKQTRFSNINWRREAIYPALALAEVCVFTPWALALISAGERFQPERAAGVCLAVVLCMLYLARGMEALRVNSVVQRVVVALIMFGLILAALRLIVFSAPQWTGWTWLPVLLQDTANLHKLLPNELVIVGGAVWLCWRGLRLATKPLDVFAVMLGFQIGIVSFTLFVVVDTLVTGQDIIIFIPPFFFSQLLALGLTRVETIPRERGGRRPPFTGWWLAMLVGSAGVIILLAGAISAMVLGIGPEKLLRWLLPFLAIITLPIAIIFLPIIALLGFIAEALVRMVKLRWPQVFTTPEGTPIPSDTSQLPPVVQTALRVIGYGKGAVTILVLLAALVAVIFVVGRWRAAHRRDEGEEHESIWSARALWAKFRTRIQDQLARLGNLTNLQRFGASGLFAAWTIRRIYAQTVRLAASRGYPRPPAHTPYEHLATLQQAFPGCEGELVQITEAYVGVHYGELPERPDALAAIRAAFERVKATEGPGDKERDKPKVGTPE